MNALAAPPLPTQLYLPEQVIELDRRAAVQHMPSLGLMERAGTAAFQLLRTRWPHAKRITVLCGSGKNGGDGYVVARLARIAGMQTQVLALADADKLRGDARTVHNYYCQAGGTVIDAPMADKELDFLLEYSDVVVDALLGTGLNRAVRGRWHSVIRAVNDHTKPVLAVDIPSGLHGGSGAALGIAMEADATITFLGLKPGLFTGTGLDCRGDLYFDNLGLPDTCYQGVPVHAWRLDANSLVGGLPQRRRNGHKGNYGHVLVIGGDHGYTGAARLAAMGAARAGAGLVSIATRAEHAHLLTLATPELMCHGVETPETLAPLLEKADAVVIGPGLGQSPWAQTLLAETADVRKPVVADADALNLIARFGWDGIRLENTVFTPHPGEAARLLQRDTAAVQADRIHAAHTIMDRFGCVCVLKGAGTIISAPDETPSICSAGNPGMACGGSGDVLAGVIGALIAQGADVRQAAKLGVCLHAHAGDLAAASGERGMTPDDILSHLRQSANPHGRG